MGGEHSFVTCFLNEWAQQHGHTVIGVPHELLFAITQIVTNIPSKIFKMFCHYCHYIDRDSMYSFMTLWMNLSLVEKQHSMYKV